jgi:putative transposase
MRHRWAPAHSLCVPRPPRFVLPGYPHHVTQRGNYRQDVFFRDEDRRFYLELLREFSVHCGVAIQAYCLMSNHVHLIAVPHNAQSLSRMLQRVHSEYARGVHLRLRRVGHLWQSRFSSVPLDETHFWAAMAYVEQNPARAGMVVRPWDWRWSSARAHVEGRDDGWLDLVRWRARYSTASWRQCLELGVADHSLLERIREGTSRGWPLGDEAFLQQIERELGTRARRGKPGRPRKGPGGEIALGASSGSLFGGEACEIGN